MSSDQKQHTGCDDGNRTRGNADYMKTIHQIKVSFKQNKVQYLRHIIAKFHQFWLRNARAVRILAHQGRGFAINGCSVTLDAP